MGKKEPSKWWTIWIGLGGLSLTAAALGFTVWVNTGKLAPRPVVLILGAYGLSIAGVILSTVCFRMALQAFKRTEAFDTLAKRLRVAEKALLEGSQPKLIETSGVSLEPRAVLASPERVEARRAELRREEEE